MKKLLLILLIIFLPGYVIAEEVMDASQEHELALPEDPDELADFEFDNLIKDIARNQMTAEQAQHTMERIENEFWYVIILAGLSIISLLIVLHYLKLRPDSTPKDFVSATGLSLIVFGTIILVLIVDTSEQLTAAIGILGAIAGYLFRTAQESSSEVSSQREP